MLVFQSEGHLALTKDSRKGVRSFLLGEHLVQLMGCWTAAPSYQSDLDLGRSLVPSLVAQSYQLAVHSEPMSFPSDGHLALTKDSRKGARSFLLGVHWEKKTAAKKDVPSYRLVEHLVQ